MNGYEQSECRRKSCTSCKATVSCKVIGPVIQVASSVTHQGDRKEDSRDYWRLVDMPIPHFLAMQLPTSHMLGGELLHESGQVSVAFPPSTKCPWFGIRYQSCFLIVFSHTLESVV